MDTGDGGLLEVFAGGSGPAAGDDGERSGILHFALNTDDVDAAAQRVRDAGAEITVEPKTVELDSEPKMSIRIAFCKGPDGELIEFFQTL
jgi:glyoxylase I family protein